MLVHVPALRIHLSEVAHEAIIAFPEFVTECRGEISVKVVQNLTCYNLQRNRATLRVI